MKKLRLLIAFTLVITFSFAQLQRTTSGVNKPDSVVNNGKIKMDEEKSKKQKLKDLNLTKDQKSKIKEQRQSAKTKKAAIESDNKLSADEKTAKLKELKTDQAKNVMSILNDEQKEKMKKTMKEKRKKKKTEEENK